VSRASTITDVSGAARIEVLSEARLMPTRMQRCARRTAHRRGDIGLREARALCSQAVDVGCLEKSVAQVAHIADT